MLTDLYPNVPEGVRREPLLRLCPVGALPEGQYQVFPEEEGYIFDAANWHWVYLAQEPGQPFDFTSQTD